ncbi:MAG: hypothetical protein COS97_01635 [Candidatus Nealsonbacteria bacterium CG07_land_8_20_14_0_80_40_10]|nr:MAG: hypothetical protein COS97_01635 [Candidatus Nealsonbacteria bacterium CG07_land_8_20_14_0_80_40_10]
MRTRATAKKLAYLKRKKCAITNWQGQVAILIIVMRLTDKESCYFSFISGKYWDGKSSQIDKTVCPEKFSPQSPEVKTCLALTSGDATLCGDNPACKIFFNTDLNFCQDISEKKDVDIKQTECIRNVALLKKDVSICEKIPAGNLPEINDCILDFVGHILPDASFCEKITDKQMKTGCLIEAAVGQLSSK